MQRNTAREGSEEEEEIDVVLAPEDTGEEQLVKVASAAPGATCSSSRRSGDVRSLLHFVSVAGGDIKAALDKSAPCKRSVDHRKYLQKQLCRLTSPGVASNHQHSNLHHLHTLQDCPGTAQGGAPFTAPTALPHDPHSPPPSQSCSPTYSVSPQGGGTQSAEQLVSRRSAGLEADSRSSPDAHGESTAHHITSSPPLHAQVSNTHEQQPGGAQSTGHGKLSLVQQAADHDIGPRRIKGATTVDTPSPDNYQTRTVFTNEQLSSHGLDNAITQGGACYTGVFIQGPITAPSVVPVSESGRSSPSSPGGQCMASPAAAHPATSAASPCRSPNLAVFLSPTSPLNGSASPTTMVVATPGTETKTSNRPEVLDAGATTVRECGLLLPPEIVDDDRDPLFEVPGVVDPTRGRKEDKDGAALQKSSIPLRQRQLPASFWKEPRPEERRAARHPPLDTADLLAHGAFFVPHSAGLGGKSHAYDSYKAMADIYGTRYQGLVGEAHRAAASASGLPSTDYLLSGYGSKLPTLTGVTADPASLSVVATAAAYHSTAGLYPWPYSLLQAEAEKTLATRLQGSHPGAQPQHNHHHLHHHHQHHNNHQQHPLLPASTPISAGTPVVHAHSLLYHHRQPGLGSAHSSRSSSSVASTPGPAVGSPPGAHSRLHGPCSSPPRPILWDPLTALSAQSLIRQPPMAAANLWRPIPTKTLSAYQSRFHPFADVR